VNWKYKTALHRVKQLGVRPPPRQCGDVIKFGLVILFCRGDVKMLVFILGLLVVVMVIVTYVVVKRKGDLQVEQNGPEAAGMNFDLEDVRPLLERLSLVFDSGFSESEIGLIQSKIDVMDTDHEEKEIGTFDITYKGKPEKVRVVAEVHIEGDSKECVLYMFSQPKIVQVIDDEMIRFTEEMDM
jgi:hypothetical protein